MFCHTERLRDHPARLNLVLSDSASYVTHEYWRMGSDTLLDELCWDRTPVDTMAQYRHDQQAHRITRAASPLWLRQAQQALHTQKAQYEASGDLQMMKRG